jgi:hypothetical protein
MFNNKRKLFLVALLCLCFGISQTLYAEKKTVQLDNNDVIKIDLPPKWKTTHERGNPGPGIERNYSIRITPPSDEKIILWFTIGRPQDRTPSSGRLFNALVNRMVSSLIPDSVEQKAEWKEVPLRTAGNAKYCILTDKSLVDKPPQPDEYLYIVAYFANYNNEYFVFASMFTDDRDNATFRLMLNTLSSIEPFFNED